MTTPRSDFDARARTWDEDASKADRARLVAEAIASGVSSLAARTVLEYGAGTGLLGLERPRAGSGRAPSGRRVRARP